MLGAGSPAARYELHSELGEFLPERRARAQVDSALLKAHARGFRWRKLLETGDYATIEEIAEVENINPSYVSRVLRMTLLAPEIVEVILAGKQPEGLPVAKAMQPSVAALLPERKGATRCDASKRSFFAVPASPLVRTPGDMCILHRQRFTLG